MGQVQLNVLNAMEMDMSKDIQEFQSYLISLILLMMILRVLVKNVMKQERLDVLTVMDLGL